MFEIEGKNIKNGGKMWIHNTAALEEGKFHAMQAENVLNKISIML